MPLFQKVAIFAILLANSATRGESISISNELRNKNWDFKSNNLTSIELPASSGDAYKYVACEIFDGQVSELNCAMTIEHENTQLTTKRKKKKKKSCKFQLGLGMNEVMNTKSLWLQSVGEERVVVRQSLTNVLFNGDRYEGVFNVRFHVIDMKRCDMVKNVARVSTQSPNYFVAYESSFDVIATDMKDPNCRNKYCLYTYDYTGAQVYNPVEFLPDNLFVEFLNFFSVYPKDPKNLSAGFFVVAEYSNYIDGKYLYVLSQNSAGEVETDTWSHFEDYDWSVKDDEILVCIRENSPLTAINCTLRDERMKEKINVQFDDVAARSSYKIKFLQTGGFLLWAQSYSGDSFNRRNKLMVKRIDRSSSSESVYEFDDLVCYEDDLRHKVYDIYENDKEVCLSTFCYVYVYPAMNVNQWNLKCINKAALR